LNPILKNIKNKSIRTFCRWWRHQQRQEFNYKNTSLHLSVSSTMTINTPLSHSHQAIKIIAVFSPLATSFFSSTKRLPSEKRFILPCQSSIIEDNDVGNGKIKNSLTTIVSPPTIFAPSQKLS